LELRQLVYFVKVAQKQHMTKAAQELHVAQSAVSRQIRLLEEEMQVELFMHKGRNVQLTAAGKLFLQRAVHILSDLDKAVLELQEFADPELGEIRLGFPHSLGLNLVPQVVSKFRAIHPQVKFSFEQGTYTQLLQQLLDGKTDLALISPLPDNHPQVTGKLLLTEELFAILPMHHPLSKQRAISLSQLKDDSFILFREGHSLRSIVWDSCLNSGFTPNISFEGEETDTIRGLVAAGMGVSLLPETALATSGTLETAKVNVRQPNITRTIGLIHLKNRQIPRVSQYFQKFILQFFHAD
jgi:LysR family transcriptional activator of glutamate synthase operon